MYCFNGNTAHHKFSIKIDLLLCSLHQQHLFLLLSEEASSKARWSVSKSLQSINDFSGFLLSLSGKLKPTIIGLLINLCALPLHEVWEPMKLAPEAQLYLQLRASLNLPDLRTLSPEEGRRIFEETSRRWQLSDPPAVESVEQRSCDGPNGPVSLRI
mgnify:CR=1 FL=1